MEFEISAEKIQFALQQFKLRFGLILSIDSIIKLSNSIQNDDLEALKEAALNVSLYLNVFYYFVKYLHLIQKSFTLFLSDINVNVNCNVNIFYEFCFTQTSLTTIVETTSNNGDINDGLISGIV